MASSLSFMQSAAYAVLFVLSLQITAFSMPQNKVSALADGQTDASAAWTDSDWLAKNFCERRFDLEFPPYVNPK